MTKPLEDKVRLVTSNLDWATGVNKDRDQLGHLVTRLYAAWGLVLLTQETKNFRLLAVLRALTARYHLPRPLVMQGVGPAKAGTAMAGIGVRVQRFRLFLGGRSRATLPRWVTRGRVRLSGGVLALFSAHVPPPRVGWAPQEKYLRRLRRRLARVEARGHSWAVGGDFNADIQRVAQLLGGHVLPGATPRGIGIIASAGVKTTRFGRDTYGLRQGDTDHPAVWADVKIIPLPAARVGEEVGVDG